MRMIGTPAAEFLPISPAVFSPDRRQFVIVTREGNLATDTNDYKLWLYQSAQVFQHPHPVLLATMPTGSNSPGIDGVRWLSDNATILFLGAKLRDHQQIFAVDVRSRKLRQLTHQPTDIVAFDATGDLRTIAFEARPPAKNLFAGTTRERGLVITNQFLPDVLNGKSYGTNLVLDSPELFVKTPAGTKEILPPNNRHYATSVTSPYVVLSPSGRYLAVTTMIFPAVVPKGWLYHEKFNEYLLIPTFSVVDVKTGQAHELLDAVSASEATKIPMAWSADEKTLIVNSYLPLSGKSAIPYTVRQSSPFQVEVNIHDGTYHTIAQGRCNMLSWDPKTSTAVLRPEESIEGSDTTRGQECGAGTYAYHKTGDTWKRLPGTPQVAGGAAFTVQIEQDYNTPPKVFVTDSKTGRKALLLDPNPQFANLQFGKVQEIHFNGTDGVALTGGLYFPVDYIPGKRYPLIIQTHGWNPKRYAIDGESSAGYAAQILAGDGFMVAQLPEYAAADSGPNEGPQGMAEYQGVIDYLDKQGFIDRTHVGLQAWSRTGFAVRYMLAFSSYPIGAAVVTDALDAGYFDYIVNANTLGTQLEDALNGGAPPYGAGLQTWFAHAPSFNIDKVHTPMLNFMFGPYSASDMWGQFGMMRSMHKPVELVYLPDSNHWPLRPVERVTVQQGAVDWYRFWLQGYEDPDPAKAAQYRRWEALRALPH